MAGVKIFPVGAAPGEEDRGGATTIFMSGPELPTLPVRIYSYMSDRIDPTVAAVSALVVMISMVLVAVLNLLGGLRRLTSE
jgi:ABC-type spermidine/putrescine transport system permease subunit II